MQKIVYRFRYFKRRIWRFFGYCERCGESLSITTRGRGICTNGDCSST